MFRENHSQRGEYIQSVNQNLWGIVLAGGEGTRLRNLVEKIYGYHRPKQYCTLIGSQSLIKHTIKRASMIIPHQKILTVVNSHHSRYIKEELHHRPEETIIVQPCPRETSAGILLPVSKIYKSDPDSTVAIFPSDHFILEENKFVNYIKEAAIFVERNPDLIVMIGIRPDRIESGLGWIERGNEIFSDTDHHFHQVKKFWEKPGLSNAASLFEDGCLINTFIIVAKSETLIKKMRSCLPSLMNAFEPIREKLGTEQEKFVLERFFKFIPEINFSKDFLEKITESLAVLEIPDVYWSDWGEEQRVIYDIERFNLSFAGDLVLHHTDLENIEISNAIIGNEIINNFHLSP